MTRPDPDTLPPARWILDVGVHASSYEDATRRICGWARAGDSRYVCACNVHMVMEAHDHPSFRTVVNDADLVVPDGMPLVWALRRLGAPDATRVYGPDLMRYVVDQAEAEGIPVGLYGGDPATLEELIRVLEARWPRLELVYKVSPPFGPARFAEGTVQAVKDSGAKILFVALGCPKQERWMNLHHGAIPAVMLGVGAAFDFFASRKRQAPGFLQDLGLEWAFRFGTEPRRLWRRYAVHNPRFVALMARFLLENRGRAENPTGGG